MRVFKEFRFQQTDNKFRRGYTLVELLIVVALVGIMAAGTTIKCFPSKEDLTEKSPEIAITDITRKARKLAHLYGKNVRVHAYAGECTDAHGNVFHGKDFPLKKGLYGDKVSSEQISQSQEESVKEFLSAISNISGYVPNLSVEKIDKNAHKTFVILEDESERLLFDNDDQLQYVVINKNTTVPEIFNPRIDPTYAATGKVRDYFEINPSGLNEPMCIVFTQPDDKKGTYSYEINSLGKVTSASSKKD